MLGAACEGMGEISNFNKGTSKAVVAVMARTVDMILSALRWIFKTLYKVLSVQAALVISAIDHEHRK